MDSPFLYQMCVCVGGVEVGKTTEICNEANANTSAQSGKKFCSKCISGTVIESVSLNTPSVSTLLSASEEGKSHAKALFPALP